MATNRTAGQSAGSGPAGPGSRRRPPAGASTPGSTRDRILSVALDLFTEQGYDKTSLREIAERVGVTKAALYYHFKSKDDILSGSLDEYLREVDELIAWAQEEPATLETQLALIRRYGQIVARRFRAMRFVQQNPTRMQDDERGQWFQGRMRAVNDLLAGANGTTTQRIRALSAILTLHVGMMAFAVDDSIDPAEATAAGQQVADELIVANSQDAGDGSA